MLASAEDIANRLEEALIEKIENKHLSEIQMMAFGFDPYDLSTIKIWFFDKWEDFIYCDDEGKIAQIKDMSFSTIVDKIGWQEDLPKLDDYLHPQFLELKSSLNRLVFADQKLNNYYAKLEALRRFSLVEAVQLLSKRKLPFKFSHLVGLWVENLNSAEHPELVAMLSNKANCGLLPLRVECTVDDSDIEVKCWCRLTRKGIYFFSPDPEKFTEFTQIFDVSKNTCCIEFKNIQYFGLLLHDSMTNLYISTNHKLCLNISSNSTGTDGALVADNFITELMLPHFQEYCEGEEIELSGMPSPNNEAKFNAWLVERRILNVKFGWKELERSVGKHGIDAAIKFLPSVKPEDVLFNVLHFTAVSLFVKHQEFSLALKSYQFVTKSFQKRLEKNYINILITLKMDIEFKKQLAYLRSKKYCSDWREYALRGLESFFYFRKGDNEKAIQILETIPSKAHLPSYKPWGVEYPDYPWYAACAYAIKKPDYALEQFKIALNRDRPLLPIDNDFSKYPAMYSLIEQKNNSIAYANSLADQIYSDVEMVTIASDITGLIMRDRLEAKLLSAHPQHWREVEKISDEAIKPYYLFEDQGEFYNLSYAGKLYSLTNKDGRLKSQKKRSVSGLVDCVYQLSGELYIATKGEGILIVELTTGKLLDTHLRLFNEKVSGMFVDERYMLICSSAGVEFYIKKQGVWIFINLLGVATTSLAYSWAKDVIIVDDYLYITAGNAGLLTYKLNGDQTPRFLTRLALTGNQPFIDRIQRIDDRLLLNVSCAIWIVDISQRAQPKMAAFLRGTKKSQLALPIIAETERWLIFDKKEPVIWELDPKSLKQKEDLMVTSTADFDLNIYYHFHDVIKFSNGQYLVSDDHGIAVLQAVNCQALTNLSIILENQFDIIFEQIIDRLKSQPLEKNQKISYLKLADTGDQFCLTLFSKRSLAGLQSFSSDEIASFQFTPENMGEGDNNNDQWPYNDLLYYMERKEKALFIKKTLHKIAQTNELRHLFSKKTTLLSQLYTRDIDRVSVCVEQLIKL